MSNDPNAVRTRQIPSIGENSPAGTLAREWAWLLLVVGAVGNAVASAAGTPMLVHLVLGLVTAVAGWVLLAQWLRGRR